MFEDSPKNIKKLVTLVVLVCVVLIVGPLLYKYLTTGTISVQSNGTGDYVSVEGVLKQGNNSLVSKQAQRQLSIRVKAGTYQISAYDQHGFNGSSRIITIHARQNLHFTLAPNKTSYPEPVYGNGVDGFVADRSHMLFVDSADSTLKGAGINGVPSPASGMLIKSAKWATTDLGIAQANNGGMYIVHGMSLSPLQAPLASNSGQSVGYDISSTGETYISRGNVLYAGSLDNKFKRLYSAPSALRLVAATVNKAAVAAGSIAPQADEGGAVKVKVTDANQGFIAIVSNDGTVKKTSWFASSISWSPDGNYLLVSGASGNAIFNSSLQKKYTISINNADLLTWLTNSELLYSIDSQLWVYNIKTQQAEKLAALAMGDSVTAIYPAVDGSFVYFSADNGEKTQLYRVGLKGQLADKHLTPLGIFMPEVLGSCNLNYINFTRPIILISYPLGASQQNCQSLAEGELQTYGLDMNRFQYDFIPQAGD